MRLRLICSALILTLAAFAPSAFADSYTYATMGCFSSPASCSSGGSTTPAVLLFGTTTSGLNFNGVGSMTLSGTNPVTIDLGTLSYVNGTNGTAEAPLNEMFTLAVTFSSLGNNGNTFTAPLVTGSVVGNGGLGGINFITPPPTISFMNDGITYDLTLTDSVYQVCRPNQTSCANPTQEIYATITPVSAPDASGLSLLGASGLFLIGAFKRKFVS